MRKTTGKSIIFLGDSITEGAGAACKENCYVSLVAKDGEFAVGHNFGVSATRIAPQRVEQGAHKETFVERIARLPETADYVLVFGGTNDYGHGDAPMGKRGDVDEETFYGSVYVLLNGLMDKYPTAKIALLTPIHRANEHRLFNEFGVRNVGSLSDYAQAEREVCEELGIPVLDLYKTSGICPDNEVNRKTYATDGLHPNDAGHRLIADKILDFLEYQL